MGSIFGHKIDYNRVEVVRGLAAQTQQKIDPSVPPPHLPGLRISYFMARTRAGSKDGARLVSGVY